MSDSDVWGGRAFTASFKFSQRRHCPFNIFTSLGDMFEPNQPNHVHPFTLAASLPSSLPDARIRYGNASPVQFADLRLPPGAPPSSGFPVVIFIHGGGWLADWTKDYSSPFVEALTAKGVATWDIEFRRMGNSGGGYPNMFHDVALAADHLRHIADTDPLDLSRLIATGHSTGGHLALWLAGRRNLSPASSLYTADPIPLQGVISIGGVNDLEYALAMGNRTDIVTMLGVDTKAEAASFFGEASPGCLLPFNIPQTLVIGKLEETWRIEMTLAYARAAIAAGDKIRVVEPDNANHFDVIDPQCSSFFRISHEIINLTYAQ